MSMHIFIFGPTPFVESLVHLSQSDQLLTQVGCDFEDSDAVLYEQMHSAIIGLKDKQSAEKNFRVLILTPQFGDRYTTIALSIPIQELFVISGVNVQTLYLLHASDISEMYQKRQIIAPSTEEEDLSGPNKYPPLL